MWTPRFPPATELPSSSLIPWSSQPTAVPGGGGGGLWNVLSLLLPARGLFLQASSCYTVASSPSMRWVLPSLGRLRRSHSPLRGPWLCLPFQADPGGYRGLSSSSDVAWGLHGPHSRGASPSSDASSRWPLGLSNPPAVSSESLDTISTAWLTGVPSRTPAALLPLNQKRSRSPLPVFLRKRTDARFTPNSRSFAGCSAALPAATGSSG